MVYRVRNCQKEEAKQMREKRKKNHGPSGGGRRVDQVDNQALDRLLGRGYSHKQAIEMIGSAVVEEIWTIMHDHKPFDRARFATLLEQLG
ncbi:hypothetical protein ccbrp13_66070 [Ktedonobacteria bacterium brp13]|nr:hypothetical protein ccbrp13_66070 [Ktedonobacteria bacterium brp13]